MMKIPVKELDGGNLLVNSDFEQLLLDNGIDTAEKLWDLTSDPVKNVRKERGTERAFLNTSDETVPVETYIKRYQPIPFKECIKNLISFKPYNFDAFHEWKAILTFHEMGLSTMVPIAVGRVGKRTCNLTLGITDYRRASEIFSEFSSKDKERKRALIEKIANLAGAMHSGGFAHQDFYLVHFFVRENNDDELFLIDLQRLIMQEKLSSRWRVKDLGQLLFSARDFVSNTDILFFWKKYSEKTGKNIYRDKSMLLRILGKADAIRKRQKRKSCTV